GVLRARSEITPPFPFEELPKISFEDELPEFSFDDELFEPGWLGAPPCSVGEGTLIPTPLRTLAAKVCAPSGRAFAAATPLNSVRAPRVPAPASTSTRRLLLHAFDAPSA